MVAVEVLDEHDNMEAQSQDNGMYLSIISLISLLFSGKFENKSGFRMTCLSARRKEIHHLLYSPRPMHIQRDIDKVLCHRFTDDAALLICRKFQQLLTKVVSKGIWKENP